MFPKSHITNQRYSCAYNKVSCFSAPIFRLPSPPLLLHYPLFTGSFLCANHFMYVIAVNSHRRQAKFFHLSDAMSFRMFPFIFSSIPLKFCPQLPPPPPGSPPGLNPTPQDSNPSQARVLSAISQQPDLASTFATINN